MLALTCVFSIAYGARQIPYASVVKALFAYDPTNFDHLAVRGRIPRTLTGLLVGAALGLGGAVMQGVARNPLADPGILGVNAGASLFIVIGISVFGISSATGYVWFGFAGAAAAITVVYGIASLGRAGATPIKLALAGAAMSAALISVLTAFLLTDLDVYDRFRFWQVGALSGRTFEIVGQILPFIAIGIVVALSLGKLLNGLSMGDDVAAGLGQNIAVSRAASAAAVIVLCGAATAAAGPIGFIGLAVPHIARVIAGNDYRWILPYSMLLGPVILLISDVIGRLLLPNSELQVGIITAFLGAPVFILLVRRRKLSEL